MTDFKYPKYNITVEAENKEKADKIFKRNFPTLIKK